MTTNERNLESVKPQTSGDHQVAGTPITKTEDNAQQQRQEKLTAAKAFRFTSGDAAPFTIDMGNGEKVQDKRPLRQENSAGEQGKLDPSKIPMADVKDGQGHILQKNYADGRHTDIHYDKNGQPDEMKTPDGQDYKRHIGKDGKPDGTWDVTVPKDKSPDGKEHHYNTHIDVKVDGDGAVSWTTKAGEHSKIDTDGKWHKDVIKEASDADALHTDLLKRDMGASAQKRLDEINKNGEGTGVYDKLSDADKKQAHLETVDGKEILKLGPAPEKTEDPATAVKEAKQLSESLFRLDEGHSAQQLVKQINAEGNGEAVYKNLSEADKKEVHLEDHNGVKTLVLGAEKTHPDQDSMDSILKQARTLIEANDLSTGLLTRDMGATAQKTLDEINKNDDGKKVYEQLSADDKKMVHLELVNGKEVLKLGEAPIVYKDGKEEELAGLVPNSREHRDAADSRPHMNAEGPEQMADKAVSTTGDHVSDASDAKAEAAKIKAMLDKNGDNPDTGEVSAELKKYARTHASQFEAMCDELAHSENGPFGLLALVHVEKGQNGKIKVTFSGSGALGVAGATLYDGKPGATGNE
jgi:hypothetical protein